MPMQLLFLQDRYLFLPGLIEKHSDYAKVCFKWKEEMENYSAVEIRLLIALQKSDNAERQYVFIQAVRFIPF